MADSSIRVEDANDTVDTFGSDDDFGSFDEASIEEIKALNEKAEFDSTVFQNPTLFEEKLQAVVDKLFPETGNDSSTSTVLLSENASKQFESLSKTPRLQPPNWTRLKIRHNLLVRLGVPINLDELESKSSGLGPVNTTNTQRKRSITEHDINWDNFTIPEYNTLDITPEKEHDLLNKTNDVLSGIEEYILSNTSQLFLQNSADAALDTKLQQMKENYQQLVELSSVWQEKTKELRHSQEIYESVVQNMVGHSQKLRRNELLEQLSRTKGKRF